MSRSEEPLNNAPLPAITGQDAKLRVKNFAVLSKQEMHDFIDSLAPKKEMLAGIQLLHRVLDATYTEEKKSEKFLDFIKKAQTLLRNSGKLLRYDFEPQPDESPDSPHVLGHTEHLKALDNDPPMSRRRFFNTLSNSAVTGVEAALGLGFAAYGATDLAASKSPEPSAESGENFFVTLKNYMDDNKIPGFLDLGVGVVFMADAARTVGKIRQEKEEKTFEQISNAVSEFTQRANGEEKMRPARRNGKHKD